LETQLTATRELDGTPDPDVRPALPMVDLLALRRIRQTGFAGSCMLVLGSILSGVLPWRDVLAAPAWLMHLRLYVVPAVAAVFVGIALVVLAWWRLGGLIHARGRAEARADDDDPPPRLTTMDLAVTLACWSAPLLVAAPLFSRDVFSYIAQGQMTVQGIDSYTFGPAILGAPLSLDVPAIWLYTPAPYGPVFLTLAAQVADVVDEQSKLGILGMRLLAWLGIALMIWAVPRVARACKINPASALWLGVLNPLVILHLVGDAHNDAVMIGLMMAGLAVALNRKPALGATLITLAALVKATAALGLVFLVPIWAAQLKGRGGWVRAAGMTTAVTAVVVVVTTAVAGTGYGWVAALDTPAIAHTWTSIFTDIGYWSGLLVSALGIGTMNQALLVWRGVGLAAAAAVCLYMLRKHDRFGPIVGMGIGMSAVVLLGPVMHPWYLLWAMVPLAAAAEDPRIRKTVIVLTLAFTVLALPGGVTPSVAAVGGAVIGALVVFGGAWLAADPRWRRRGALAVAALREMVQGQPVPVHAEAADDSGRYRRDHRVVPELLARVDVGDVHLDQRRPQQGAGVPDRVRVMRPRPGVEHDRGGVVGGVVKPSDQFGLGVGLSDFDLEAEFLADPHTPPHEVRVRGDAVDVGLPGAEPPQVGPVEDKHLHDDDTSR
jgi:hypothetical protein